MIVLGIDGGMVRLGLGVVEAKGEQINLVTYGLINHPRLDEKYNQFLNEGIEQITDCLPRFLQATKPDIIVSETIPAGKLGASSSQVIAAVTACKVIAYQAKIPWYDIGANTVKKGLTEDYRASKTLIRNTILGLFPTIEQRHREEKLAQKEAGDKKRPGIPQDVFDGIAVAVVGARKYGIN